MVRVLMTGLLGLTLTLGAAAVDDKKPGDKGDKKSADKGKEATISGMPTVWQMRFTGC
jgi:hypothetical protein